MVNAFSACKGGLNLSTKGYYFSNRYKKERAVLLVHVAKLFALAGDKLVDVQAEAETVFATEKRWPQGQKYFIKLHVFLL